MKRPVASALTLAQLEVTTAPSSGHCYLEGAAGTGKTTAGVERMLHLMEEGVPGGSILVLAPQRSLAAPYSRAIELPGVTSGSQPVIVTPAGLVRRMVELYWPLAGNAAGFGNPDQPPVFLTLESAQYFMSRVAGPQIEAGRFASLTMDRNRLYSQVVDNLNKAAFIGFPHTEIGSRLSAATSGDPEQIRIYQDAQICATLFRSYCLENNLLDFSLQVEVFRDHLWKTGPCRQMLEQTYRHLIFDNIEEETPFALDLVCEWLPNFDSALLIFDTDSGFRSFLGADPQMAYSLKEGCSQRYRFEHSLTETAPIQALEAALPAAFKREGGPSPDRALYLPAVGHPEQQLKFHNQMVEWAASLTARLIDEQGIEPGEIVILAPYMPDSLRFSLIDRLKALGVPVRSHRPSRSLREEPAAQCLLTLAALAHPDWGFHPTEFDLSYALVEAIEGMDLVRAQLLMMIVNRSRPQYKISLLPFDTINSEMQERITYALGQRYETLRIWLEDYAQTEPDELDFFFSRLFGEVLSQPGFKFHSNYIASETAANLVDSAAGFRQAVCGCRQVEDTCTGKDFLQMVQEGVISSTYVRSWGVGPSTEVLISPAYTFLMGNRPVDVQIWLDITSSEWGARLDQPLTHPYVLSRWWPKGAKWTDLHELETEKEVIYHLILGLVRRCRSKVYFGFSTLSEQGFNQQGPLMHVFQRLMTG